MSAGGECKVGSYVSRTAAVGCAMRLEVETGRPYLVGASPNGMGGWQDVVAEFPKCSLNARFESRTDGNEALARSCAESLSRIHGGTYQAVMTKHNRIFQDCWTVVKQK